MLRPTPAPSSALVPITGAARLTRVALSATGWSSDVTRALDTLLDAPHVLGAIHAARRLQRAAARAPHRAPPVAAWPDPLDAGLDAMSTYGLLHAMAELPGAGVDDLLLRAMEHADAGVREHAVWALARRPAMASALAPLVELVAGGGFVSMLAGSTLLAWAGDAPGPHGSTIVSRLRRAALMSGSSDARRRLVDLAAIIAADLGPRLGPPADAMAPGQGIRIVQMLLHGHLDPGLRDAGAGDGGGLVTLLVTLARALGRRPDVASVVTIGRRRAGDPAGSELMADGATLERISFGGETPLSMGAAWEHWPTIVRELGALLERLGPVDALHLRLGDVGSMAATQVARRTGTPVVFTLAPDPHGVIDAAERAGNVSRASFAAYDLVQHAWFRARLVESIATDADELVMFPRPGGQQEVADLLDLPLDDRRVTVVPEGIDLTQARAAHARAAHDRHPDTVITLAARIAAGPADRVGLPLIVSAARLHPIKGLDRLVAAWLRDPRLRDGYNLVIAGGELDDGTLEEVRTLAAIRDVGLANGHAGDIPGLYLPGSLPNGDIAALLAAAALGVAPSIGPRGVYVCASAKEEFGLSIVEALAAGLPVVAPNGGGPRTYVAHGRTGILTDTTSIGALALATIRAAGLWQDPERSPMAAAQVSSMGIDAMADRLTRVYRTVGSLHEAAG